MQAVKTNLVTESSSDTESLNSSVPHQCKEHYIVIRSNLVEHHSRCDTQGNNSEGNCAFSPVDANQLRTSILITTSWRSRHVEWQWRSGNSFAQGYWRSKKKLETDVLTYRRQKKGKHREQKNRRKGKLPPQSLNLGLGCDDYWLTLLELRGVWWGQVSDIVPPRPPPYLN